MTTAMVLAAAAIALIPWVRHFIFFMRLQTSLITRLGPIWEETEGIRAPLFRTNFLSDLNEIEQKHGEKLTDEERGWLRMSRHQQEISTRWAIAVFLLLFVGMFIAMSVFRQ